MTMGEDIKIGDKADCFHAPGGGSNGPLLLNLKEEEEEKGVVTHPEVMLIHSYRFPEVISHPMVALSSRHTVSFTVIKIQLYCIYGYYLNLDIA